MSKQRRQREDEDETTMSAGDGSDTDTRCPMPDSRGCKQTEAKFILRHVSVSDLGEVDDIVVRSWQLYVIRLRRT